MAPRDMHAGKFYERTPKGLREIEPQPCGVWVCRRVVDFAPSPVPTGAAFTECPACGWKIAYDPQARNAPHGSPKICMQCARIEPLPIEREH